MRQSTITINGMSCTACANSIINTLVSKQLLADIHINIITKTATLTLDDCHDLESIFLEIKRLGYEPLEKSRSRFTTHTKSPQILLQPPRATAHIQTLSPQNPPSQATHQSTIHNATSKLDRLRDICTHFNAINQRIFTPTRCVWLSGISALLILYLSMSPMLFDSALIAPFTDMRVNFFAQLVLALSSMHLGRDYYFKGFRALLAKYPTMDSLIAISTSAALVYSIYNALLGQTHWYFESICVILFFVLFGKGLEQNAKDTTSAMIRALLSHNVTQVIRLDSSTQELIAHQAINAGDMLQILPWQTIPTDGIIKQGACGLDESMLSGEVLPVEKRVGDKIYAGSVNTDRAFIMQATSPSAQSTLSRLHTLIQEAMESKPALARLADKIASYFVPVVVVLAVMAFLVWCVVLGVEFGSNVFISVLVVSCPCALGLATPMAVMIGTALANKYGIFIKQAQSFENLSKVSDVVFDKTGTLTSATLQVVEVESLCALTREDILSISAGIEQGSEHIIAKAIVQEAKARQISVMDFVEFRTFAGCGIEANDKQGVVYRLGTQELLEVVQDSRLESLDTRACIRVFLGKRVDSSTRILGYITLEDTLRQGALETIQALRDRGITSHILSGDTASNTARIARELGVVQYRSRTKPADKLAYIKALQDRGKVVLMVGDGVNDIGALASADVSLSFAHASDVSQHIADIIIYHNDLSRLMAVMRLSCKVMQNIKENLAFAFVYNIICIPIACGVLYYPAQILLNPMIAAFAMSASSVSVVLNSQRLWRYNLAGLLAKVSKSR